MDDEAGREQTGKNPGPQPYEMLRVAGQCLLIPTYLGVFPLAYGWIGSWLDHYFETRWLVVVFFFLGFFSGIRQSYFAIKRVQHSVSRK